MQTKSPIRIGYCLSLTGVLAGNAQSARLAHEIWREDVNRTGGLLGRPVELICCDDGTEPLAYAQMQVVGQAVAATGGLDDSALIAYARKAAFQTVIGDVSFGANGEWRVGPSSHPNRWRLDR
jgi:ABC-type branched-subunit amino acid transport system substrate-binding protein